MKRRTKWITLGGVLLVLAGGAYAFSHGSPKATMTTDTVKRGDLVQTVEVTGALQTDNDIQLSFGTSGVVRSLSVKVGDRVVAGRLLATLNVGSLQAAYTQAVQALNEAKANLAQQQAGISTEETAVSQADVEVAEAALRAAEQNVERVKQETTTAAEKAREDVVDDLRALVAEVRQALADADTILGVENPLYTQEFDDLLGAEDLTSVAVAKDAFERAAESRDAAENALFAVVGTDAAAAADLAEVAYADTYEMLVDTARMLDATSANAERLTLDQLTAFKSTIAAAQSALISAGSALRTSRQAVVDADLAVSLDVADAEAQVSARQADVARAQAALTSATAAPREVDLASYEAAIGQAQANVSAAAARLRDAQIIAPIAGTVTAVEIDVGESATALHPVITVLSSDEVYAVTLDLPESDVAKVGVGQTADVTFDALGDDFHVSAQVVSIDPAEKLIQDVVFYEAKVLIDPGQDLSLVKPGMSANVTITTATRSAVLFVPSRAVLEENDQKYIRLPAPHGGYEKRFITVGLRADNGQTEVLDGLLEGEIVIVTLPQR